MPVLLGPEEIAGPPDLQVPRGNLEAGSEFRQLGDDLQPLPSALIQGLLSRDEEVGMRAEPVPTDPAPELIELGQAKAIRPIDDDGIGRRDVEARLDDGRRAEELVPPGVKVAHDPLQRLLGHLAMGHGDLHVGEEALQESRHRMDALHPVVDEEDLPAAADLFLDGPPDHLGVEARDGGANAQPILGRGLDGRHIPDPQHRHVEGPGNRGGGEREHVDFGAELFQPLLGAHPKALLFVHDEEPQVAEPDVRLQEPVGADDHIDGPVPQPAQDLLLFPPRAEPGEHLHHDRKGSKAIRERLKVLQR